jgi:hypothetical protein
LIDPSLESLNVESGVARLANANELRIDRIKDYEIIGWLNSREDWLAVSGQRLPSRLVNEVNCKNFVSNSEDLKIEADRFDPFHSNLTKGLIQWIRVLSHSCALDRQHIRA